MIEQERIQVHGRLAAIVESLTVHGDWLTRLETLQRVDPPTAAALRDFTGCGEADTTLAFLARGGVSA